ncbi:vitelline membrane outer layer protein 1 homolog [Aquarana catesbeiana]|uniref:vitelline membrane outer layer protein 1 homolog n=1 Tax=Aquarana catesbeiana TaxID=8400 RepID=UPI003CCA3591
MARTMLLNWIVTLTLLYTTLTHEQDIHVNNGGIWGYQGQMDMCPPGTKATGFDLLVEPPQGDGDDTALNAIKLLCTKPGDRTIRAEITSKTGAWGIWTGVKWCSYGALFRFSLQVEASIGSDDDTAANNIKFECPYPKILEGNGGRWGTYGGWSDMCQKGICGIQTRVEDSQGSGDDTALNDVIFRCC